MGPGLNLVPALLLTIAWTSFAFGKGLHWGVGASPRAFQQDGLFPLPPGLLLPTSTEGVVQWWIVCSPEKAGYRKEDDE